MIGVSVYFPKQVKECFILLYAIMDTPLAFKTGSQLLVLDRLERPLQELRLSVIDRCNFRCTYCMPADSLQGRGVFLPLQKLMTDREIAVLVQAFTGLGVRKLRITGGEPLVRPGLPALIGMLAQIPGLEDIALTTNGVMLPRLADDLAEAGLGRITVSLDTLDEVVLDRMSGGKARLRDILDGIEAAERAGFKRQKINVVVQRGINDHTIMDLLAYFRGTPHTVRLIEYMDVGNSNHWNVSEVVPSEEWLGRINERWPIRKVEASSTAQTSQVFEYLDGQGQVGLISSISKPFCGGCTRARVTAEGLLYTCLFASRGTNLRPLIRHSESAVELRDRILAVWQGRQDRYSELRESGVGGAEKVEMYRMGG
jgi:cyclic pyranopterin phosphate synthase